MTLSGYMVEAGAVGRLYGPFKDANAATKWAKAELCCEWCVVPFWKPET